MSSKAAAILLLDPVVLITVPGGLLTLAGNTTAPTNALAQLFVNKNGKMTSNTTDAGAVDYNATNSSWWSRVGAFNAAGFPYEVSLNRISGTGNVSGDAADTFLDLSSDRSWLAQTSGVPSAINVRYDLLFRRKGTSVTLATQQFRFQVSTV
jgi:hypothetical protein